MKMKSEKFILESWQLQVLINYEKLILEMPELGPRDKLALFIQKSYLEN